MSLDPKSKAEHEVMDALITAARLSNQSDPKTFTRSKSPS